jgi:serine/threonine protein kinase
MAAQPLEDLTLFILSTYHEVMPHMFPLPTYELGHPLNAPEPADPDTPDGELQMDGHRLVHANEIFQDSKGQKFRVIDVIGSGTYGYVFKCQSVEQAELFCAMKIIKNLRHYKETGLNELVFHQCLAGAPNHPGKSHVMMLITSFEIHDHVILVMPLLARSLFDGICQTVPLPTLLESARSVMEQLLQALEFVHKQGIVHSDLKTDKILSVSEEGANPASSTSGPRVEGIVRQEYTYTRGFTEAPRSS